MTGFLARHGRTLVGAALGAAAGGAYAFFIGCKTGTCPLTGDVRVASVLFGFMGAVLGAPAAPSSQDRSSRRAGPSSRSETTTETTTAPAQNASTNPGDAGAPS